METPSSIVLLAATNFQPFYNPITSDLYNSILNPPLFYIYHPFHPIKIYYNLLFMGLLSLSPSSVRRGMRVSELFVVVLKDGLNVQPSMRNRTTLSVVTVTVSLVGYLLRSSKVYAGEDLHYDWNGLSLTASSSVYDECSAGDGYFRSGGLLMDLVDFMTPGRLFVEIHLLLSLMEDGNIIRSPPFGFRNQGDFDCKVFDICTDSRIVFSEERQDFMIIIAMLILAPKGSFFNVANGGWDGQHEVNLKCELCHGGHSGGGSRLADKFTGRIGVKFCCRHVDGWNDVVKKQEMHANDVSISPMMIGMTVFERGLKMDADNLNVCPTCTICVTCFPKGDHQVIIYTDGCGCECGDVIFCSC